MITNVMGNEEMRNEGMREFAESQLARHFPQGMAKELEVQIYHYAIHESRISGANWDYDSVRQIYKGKLRGILTALQRGTLFQQIESNEVQLSHVCDLSPSDMCPSLWPTVEKEVASEEEDKDKSHRYGEPTCTNCRRRGQPCHNTTYTQFQTRSADEGFTTYHLCFNCGKRWQ